VNNGYTTARWMASILVHQQAAQTSQIVTHTFAEEGMERCLMAWSPGSRDYSFQCDVVNDNFE